jgi:hypothetical protein
MTVAPEKIIMRDSRKKVSLALFGAAIAIIVISVYCFWNARRITEQLWEMANEEPSAALLLMGKATPEIMAIAPRELVRLNDDRSKNKKAGWVLIHWNLSLLIFCIIRIDLLIMPIQFVPRRLNGKLPIDLDGFLFTLFDNRQDLLRQLVLRCNPPIQALLRQRRKLDLDEIEPTGTLRRVVHLKALRQRESFLSRESLIKRTGVMGVEIILNDAYLFGFRVVRCQFFHKDGILSMKNEKCTKRKNEK